MTSGTDTHVSGDGRFVVFTSWSPNLVPGDTNGTDDVFVRDLWTGSTERVSLSVSGQQISGASSGSGISHDGRFVVFISDSADVHPLDIDSKVDVFVRDRQLGATELISITFDGSPSLYDCKWVDISDDGRFVVFAGGDSNLVAGDANGVGDVFLRDRQAASTEIVSIASSGMQGDGASFRPAISADGTRIAFMSKADNFYPHEDGASDDWHLFLRDRVTDQTLPLDVNPLGRLGNSGVGEDMEISPDGRSVVFNSLATDLLAWWDVVGFKALLWRDGEPLQPIATADGRPGAYADTPSLSWDGRLVSFHSIGPLWVAGDPTPSEDIFLQDTWLGVSQQVSSNGYADPQNVQSHHCSMSWDGRVIAFRSYADNLVPGTTPGVNHAYVRISDPLSAGMTFCWPGTSAQACQPRLVLSGQPSASAVTSHELRVQEVPNDQVGLLLYSTTGPKPSPLSFGWSCLTPPLRRMPVHPTGGTPPPGSDCTGSFLEDFNSWIASGQDPALVAGAPVFVQGWVRDPASPGGALFSDAAAFLVGP